MKTHTNDFKNQIKLQGRELESVITYTLNNEEVELRNENLNSVSPHYEGAILKSVMKQLDIDSNIDIPVGTVVNFKQGLKNKNVEQQITDIMLEGGSRFYEEFYYPNAGIDRIRRYINMGIKIDARNLMNTSYLTNQQKNFLRHNADLTQTKVAIYPYEPIGIEDYTINATVIPSIDAGEFEYLNFGNYIVYSSEKQEDTNSYKIICYDKMLYSMKEYEQFNTTYPITIREYINLLSQHLGLTFKNVNDTFPNYNKTIDIELFLNTDGQSIGYTFRDALDQLAEVTASTICINEETDELEIRYINETSDIIDEEYLKDINVNFGEMTKPINTIVLSRAGGSDKIYQSYPEDLPEEERNAIEIADNQIMNFNNRDTFIPDILNKLLGLTYSLNDFSSTGILYYNLCDRYTIKIGENNYSCIMFNDEVNITQGLEELVHTDLPEETVTDYTKADKTDRRINETYLIVDKQNQVISSVVTNITEQNTKISQLTQTVDELDSKIQDIADITVAGESGFATFTLDNINESEPVMVKVRPINDNISYLYPSTGLFPSANTFLKVRTIRFTNRTTNEVFEYEIPDDLLFYDNENYDEFYMDYGSQTCQITKRCKYNADGSVSLLAEEQIVTYTYPHIVLTDGDYTLQLLGYDYGYLFVRLMAKNIYTSQFYTKVETDSHINQKASEIELGVNQTLTNYATTDAMSAAINIKANEINSTVSETYTTKVETETAKQYAIDIAGADTDEKLEDYSTTVQMNSAINQKADQITSTVSATYATKQTTNTLSSRISQTAKDISLTVNNGQTSSGIVIGITKEDGTTSQATGTIEMNGLVKFTDLSNAGSTTINGANITTGTLSADRIRGGTMYGSSLTLTSANAIEVYGSDGRLDVKVANDGVGFYDNYGNYNGMITANTNRGVSLATRDGNTFSLLRNNDGEDVATFNSHTGVFVPNGKVYALDFMRPSLKEKKKNIKLYKDEALKLVKNSEIYSYVYKMDKEGHKKRYGFVIGNGYKTPEEVMSDKKDSVDVYSMCSILWKAVQEQQAIIENLQNRIDKLERESEK